MHICKLMGLSFRLESLFQCLYPERNVVTSSNYCCFYATSALPNLPHFVPQAPGLFCMLPVHKEAWWLRKWCSDHSGVLSLLGPSHQPFQGYYSVWHLCPRSCRLSHAFYYFPSVSYYALSCLGVTIPAHHTVLLPQFWGLRLRSYCLPDKYFTTLLWFLSLSLCSPFLPPSFLLSSFPPCLLSFLPPSLPSLDGSGFQFLLFQSFGVWFVFHPLVVSLRPGQWASPRY